ncbi:hypothetical protein [Nodularia spumigena]|nr:hypothetical protein [Nodularia spumigena]MDB9398919.1 hypothetical protein [Microcystis aeruginosa CS-567/02-A1]MDB9316088.1 hypothetical protein [Nodularia spumigena CS-590/01A]MDB9324317.1 hypothetical protein [Nodularia spumigena CS-591/07A]MDB9329866.1 hypothetical protein [Nodularia spumigena CS-591/04]MDB9333968.1 hypothetical protein [Nodularia spumigena CS-590/01]
MWVKIWQFFFFPSSFSQGETLRGKRSYAEGFTRSLCPSPKARG